jgi:periplasmic copper chaperone A
VTLRAAESGRRCAALLAVLLAACGDAPQPPETELHVSDGWARATAAAPKSARPEAMAHDTAGTGHVHHHDLPADHAGRTTAVYFTIENHGREADVLVAVESEIARSAEVHQTTVEQGIARMRPVERLVVPPGESVVLRPGGYHLMLLDLERELSVGDRFQVLLTFEKEGTRTIDVGVRTQ